MNGDSNIYLCKRHALFVNHTYLVQDHLELQACTLGRGKKNEKRLRVGLNIRIPRHMLDGEGQITAPTTETTVICIEKGLRLRELSQISTQTAAQNTSHVQPTCEN